MSHVTAASSAMGMSDVPAVTTSTLPCLSLSSAPTVAILASGYHRTSSPSSPRSILCVESDMRVKTASPFLANVLRAISTICASVLPGV